MSKDNVPGKSAEKPVQGGEFDVRECLENWCRNRATGEVMLNGGKSKIPKMDRYTRARRRAVHVRKLEQRTASMCEAPKAADDTRE